MQTAHDVFHAIEPVFNKHKTTPHVECEVRLGRFEGKRFNADLGETTWKQVIDALEKYQGWESKATTSSEVYYKGDLRMVVDGETDEQELYRKKRVSNTELQLVGRPLDARFSVSTEDPVDPDTMGEEPHQEKDQDRRSLSIAARGIALQTKSGTLFNFLTSTDHHLQPVLSIRNAKPAVKDRRCLFLFTTLI